MFNKKYGEYSQEMFEKMNVDEQMAYINALNELDFDDEFKINFIVALIMAGGDNRTKDEILSDISFAELAPSSKLSIALFNFIKSMNPESAKKKQ